MEKEIWKDVINYEGLYQVSNLGRVKSFKFQKERILKLSTDKKGYSIVCLHKDKKQSVIKVHKLVAIAFLNHEPCGMSIVVDHIDNNKENNKLSNIQLISNRENSSKNRVGVSKYTGVTWYKPLKKWCAKIHENKKNKHIGYFNKEIEASLAYQERLKIINNK